MLAFFIKVPSADINASRSEARKLIIRVINFELV